VLEAHAMQKLRLRLEKGGVLSLAGIHPSAQAFFCFLLKELFPERTVLAIVDGVKTQESFQQDLETWLALKGGGKKNQAERPLYYSAWEVLPHDSRLPHADVISERLETLVALSSSQR